MKADNGKSRGSHNRSSSVNKHSFLGGNNPKELSTSLAMRKKLESQQIQIEGEYQGRKSGVAISAKKKPNIRVSTREPKSGPSVTGTYFVRRNAPRTNVVSPITR